MRPLTYSNSIRSQAYSALTMLRRENIGGFWRIQTRPLPPPPLPKILTQIQKIKTTLPRYPLLLRPSECLSVSLEHLWTQPESGSLSSQHWSPTQDDDWYSTKGNLPRCTRRTRPRPGRIQNSTTQLRKRKAEVDEPSTERPILDRILSPSYTVDLPSEAARGSDGQYQACVSEDTADELQQSEPTSCSQDREQNGNWKTDFSDAGDDSEASRFPLSSTGSDGNKTSGFDRTRDAMSDSSKNQSDDAVNATGESDGYGNKNGNENGDEGRDDDGGGGDSSGSADDTLQPIDDPKDQQNTLRSSERPASDGLNGVAREVRDIVPQESNELRAIQGSALFENPCDDAEAFDSELSPGIPFATTINQQQLTQEVLSGDTLLEERLLDVALQAPEALQQAVAASAEEEAPRVPTIVHHHAIVQIAPSERIALINEFLKQNSARINDFCVRQQVPPAGVEPSIKALKMTWSRAWENQVELDLLTDAVLWLDILLAPFRAMILEEDLSSSRPCIEQATRGFETTGVLSRAKTVEPLSTEDQVIVQQFSDCIAQIQASNSMRTQLLEHINIDVSIFEDLLLSAENIKYRRDLGREYGQKDDLVDGLRRIYSTITCTVPVSLSAQDWIKQPPQQPKITYGEGPFRPYELPGRPEIFDHNSIAISRLSSKGAVGIQVSEHQTPLNPKYWRDLHQDMLGTIAAQKMDEVGSVKLGKNPKSMNRDWNAFYGSVYGSGMTNYAEAAAQRIESEAHEVMLKTATAEQSMKETEENLVSDIQRAAAESYRGSRRSSVEDSLQVDSRRSSTDCTDSSAMTTEVVVGNQDKTRWSKWCMNVNKPGGCSDRSNCGAESHNNEGKYCRHGNGCIFGAGKCAYIHDAPSDTGLVRPTSSQPRNSVASVDPRLQDLRSLDILFEVLANPKGFRVCNFVNKPRGCTSGTDCKFNHTLEGLACVDYQEGYCPRDFECPLKHIQGFESTPNPSTCAPSNSERTSSTRQQKASPFLSTPTSFDNGLKVSRVRNTRIDHGSPMDDICLSDSSQPTAQWSEPMDYEQSPLDRGLPPDTPTGPRRSSQYVQPSKAQHQLLTHVTDNGGPYSSDSQRNDLKRKEPFGQPRGKGLSLIARMTRDGRPLVEELLEEQYYGGYQQDYNDCSRDDEYDVHERHGDHGPRKKQKKSENWHGSLGKGRNERRGRR